MLIFFQNFSLERTVLNVAYKAAKQQDSPTSTLQQHCQLDRLNCTCSERIGFCAIHHREDTNVIFCRITRNAISSYVENVISDLPLIAHIEFYAELLKFFLRTHIKRCATGYNNLWVQDTIMIQLMANLRIPANTSPIRQAKNKVTCKTLSDNSTLVLLHSWFVIENDMGHTIWSRRKSL